MTAGVFCLSTLGFSVLATHLPEIWYGIGVFVGSFIGFFVAYYRLRWLEENLDEHIFCQGNLLPVKFGKKPSAKVFDRREQRKDVREEV